MCAAKFKLSSYRRGSNASSKMMDACVCSTCQFANHISDLWWVESWLNIDVFNGFGLYFSHPYLGDDSAPRASMAPTAPAHASLWVRAGRAAGALSSFLHGISGDPSTAVLGPVPRCVVLLLLAGTLHFNGGPSKAVVWEAWERGTRPSSLGVQVFQWHLLDQSDLRIICRRCPIFVRFPHPISAFSNIIHPCDLSFWCLTLHPLVQVAMSRCSKVRSEGQAWETHAELAGEGGIHARKWWCQKGTGPMGPSGANWPRGRGWIM